MASQNDMQMQQMAYYYRELNNQIADLKEKADYITNVIQTLSETKKAIEDIKTADPNQDIILPLGNSTYIKARIVDPNVFLMAIGTNILVEKNAEDSLEHLRKLEKEQNNALTIIQTRINQLSEQMEQIRPELEKYLF
jgi:prefoldin alpha subunit